MILMASTSATARILLAGIKSFQQPLADAAAGTIISSAAASSSSCTQRQMQGMMMQQQQHVHMHRNPVRLINSACIALVEWLPTPSELLLQHQQLIFPLLLTASYLVGANLIYLIRRAHVRKMTVGQLWKVRTMREPGVPVSLYLTFLIVWQGLVIFFPIVEPIVRFGWNRVCFFYSYPNASGCGIILEPRNVQHLKQSERTKHQVRLDWHRFSLNVGDVGREGYRHPPTVERNLPHIDYPKLGLKHWPWRRRLKYTLRSTKCK